MTPEGTRRSFITGLISLVAAPAIVRAGSLMPVKVLVPVEALNFTAADLDEMWRRAYLDLAYRMANPVLLTSGDPMMCVPERWLR